VLASRAVDCCFESRSGQTKDYKIGICCFSAKHGSLRRKSKDWLARNQDNAHTTLFLLLVNKDPRGFGRVRVAHRFRFCYVVLLSIFTFWVPCCGVRYGSHESDAWLIFTSSCLLECSYSYIQSNLV
jgi:hypothetical protein